MKVQIKIDAALPGGRVWALKVEKILSKMPFKASEWLLFPNAAFSPTNPNIVGYLWGIVGYCWVWGWPN